MYTFHVPRLTFPLPPPPPSPYHRRSLHREANNPKSQNQENITGIPHPTQAHHQQVQSNPLLIIHTTPPISHRSFPSFQALQDRERGKWGGGWGDPAACGGGAHEQLIFFAEEYLDEEKNHPIPLILRCKFCHPGRHNSQIWRRWTGDLQVSRSGRHLLGYLHLVYTGASNCSRLKKRREDDLSVPAKPYCRYLK